MTTTPNASPAETVGLTERLNDDEITAIWQTMPGGAAGWLKSFGYIQFAQAIEDEVIERLASKSQAEPAPLKYLPQYAMGRNGEVHHYYRVDDVLAATQQGREARAEPVLTKSAFEEIAESWDGCESEGIDDVGAALRRDFKRLARPAAQEATASQAEQPEEPSSRDLEQRAIGRGEALAILMGLNAESGIDEYIGSHQSGMDGEWDAHWKDDELRKLFRVDDSAWSFVQDAEERLNGLLWERADREADSQFFEGGLAEPAATASPDLLAEILALAEQGMSHGLLADDYCNQIIDKIKASGVATASQGEQASDRFQHGDLPTIEITLRQAKALVDCFGGYDAEMSIFRRPAGWAEHPAGLYAYVTEEPGEGTMYLGPTEVDDDLAINGEPVDAAPSSTASAPAAAEVRDAALEEAEEAIEQVIRDLEYDVEERSGAFTCRDAIRALRLPAGGNGGGHG